MTTHLNLQRMTARLSDGSEFPIPAKRADDSSSPIWKARNAPATLTDEDLKQLASTSAAYSELVLRCRPARVAAVARAVKDAMHASALASLSEQTV